MTDHIFVQPICKAKTRTGNQCKRFVTPGESTCGLHGKVNLTAVVPSTGNGKVKQAALVRSERAQAELAEKYGLDPTEVLRTAVDRTDAMCRRIETMLGEAEMDDREVWPALRMYREFLTTLADVCKKDLDAGVQKRRLQLDEARARVALQAIDRALTVALDNDAQRQRVRLEIGRQLQIEGS